MNLSLYLHVFTRRNVVGLLVAMLAVVSSVTAHAADWIDHPELAQLFADAGIDGTFVLYDGTTGRLAGFNRKRAEQRFVPASTYKIPHTLIGLTVGAVSSVDEVLPYGGKPQPFKQWERDMSLRDAIVLSNVPIYQQLATRIGLPRMRSALATMGYGNQMIGDDVTRFWLDGPLEISAIEQVRFLDRLSRGGLPFPEDLQQSVRSIIELERGDDWVLYGKTGWQNAPNAGVGWWVGWVRRSGVNYAFAINIDIRDSSDAEKRIALGKACLRELGIL